MIYYLTVKSPLGRHPSYFEKYVIKICRLKSEKAYYRYVQNVLPPSFLSKNIKFTVYRTITFPVALYGCDSWPLALTETRRLRVSVNRALRKVFLPKKGEITGQRRKLKNVEFHDPYCTPRISRLMKLRRMGSMGHVE